MSTASKGGALSALEKIRKQRRGEAKATEQYEVRDENAEIFATVSAQEYAELKQSRRAGNWIEGDDAEGYSDDGEEWWQSDSGSEDGGRANAPRTAKRRGTEERDAKGALPTPVGKKKKGLSAAAEMRAKGMRSLLQHFSSMASEKAGTLGPQKAADSAKQLQAIKSIEASLDLDDEDEDDSAPHRMQPASSSSSSGSSSSSSSSSGRAFAARDSFGLFGLGDVRLTKRVSGAGSSSCIAQKREASAFESLREAPGAAAARADTLRAAADEDAAFVPAGASEDAEAGSSAPPRLSGAAAERSDAEEEAEEATVRCDIFESSSEHFGARRKMVAVDLFAAGSEEAAQPQQSEPEGASRGPLVLDEAVGASEGLPVCPDGSLPFYFLDAWDDVASGTVYLFGKVWGVAAGGQQQQGSAAAVAPPQSCCVVVKRMMRPLFFFLRKQVTLDAGIEGLGADGATPEAGEAAREALLASFLREKQENAKEFLRMDGQRLKQRYHWSTWKCKATTRHYAFDAAGVPRSRNLQVVKVLCPGSAPSLEAEDLQGVTYSRVFGSNAPLTEVLLVKRRIKGPCWLKITDFCLPESPADKASWCRHEVIVEGHKQIRVWGDSRKAGGEEEASSPQPVDGKEPPAPPLTLLSLVAKSVSVSNNPSEDRALCMAAFFIQRHKDIEEQQAQPVLTKENIFCGVRRIRSGGGGKAQTGALGAPVCARAMSSGVPPLFEEKAEKSAVQVYDSERVLLTNLINRVYAQDPDVILGHNIYGADLELIARRCNFHGLPLWHKMSRLKRPKTQKPPCSNPRQQHQHQSCLWGGRVLSVGRLVCDTYLQARELLGHKTNYNLLPLLREAFPMPAAGVAASGGTGAGSKISAFHRRIATELQRMQPFPCEDLLSFYWSQDPSRLLYAANLCCLEAFMASILAQRLNCLPVTRELTTIGGNLWVRSLQNARAERNAFLLMHAFHAEKFVYPDPPGPRGKAKSHEAAAPAEMEDPSDGEGAEAPSAAPGGASRSSKGPAYAGGLVLEPRAGLYDSFVLLLDFNSLYPSIIQEYNVCFSTVRRAQASENGEAAGDEDASVWEIDSTPGLLPRVLQQLVQKRRQVKAAAQKERDPAKKASLDVKQLALKLTANSIYGCLGFSGSRFYAKPLAAYITQQGRTVLMAAKEKVEQQLRLSVLYGDTDSLMVDTGLRDEGRGEAYAESVRLGQRIKSEINRQYKKLELDLEAVFRRLLLLRKKKYACCIIEDYGRRAYKIEQKGLDFVRRDWALLTKQAGEQLLRIIFGVSLASAKQQQQQQEGRAPAPAGDEDAVDTVVALLHERLRAMREAIVGGQVPLDLFVITRALTKSPQLYAQGSGGAAQPHVLVALRMLAAGRPVRAGNEIPYIICDEDSVRRAEQQRQQKATPEFPSESKSEGASPQASASPQQQQQQRVRGPAERAFHPMEVQNLGLKPDVEYYLQHQLFPPVQRLCAHVQGTGPGRLAECLGLNPAKFGERELGEEAGDDQTGESERQKGEDRILSLIKKSDEVFKECNIPAQIPCGLCGVWLPAAQGLMTSRCGACGGWLSPSALRDTLRLYLAYIRHSFHIHITRCTECKHKFEYLPPGPLRAGASLRCPLCDGGRIVDCVSPNVLYMQLQHLRFLLSQNTGSKGSSTSASPAGMRLALDECHAAVPLPSSPQLGEPARPLNLSESLPKAGLTRAKEAAVGVKKGLELKFPLVVAALRYLRGLKSGVLCVSSESERHSLMEPVTTTMTANALNTLDLRSFFCALRTPTGAEGQSSRWALLAQTYIDAKAAAVESALPLDAGVRDPWGAPAGMQRRRSGGLPLGFKGFGSPTVTIKREVY
ncbi:DNA polymerase alpha catalytic subunit [Cyclospora cayetanensis]|uniref:DNA polymerase n=1 Tax=Cyclospora cayetanensis TaxID=88456 RepID=A0A6P6S0C3_9EIME|nr:DNA polymerase alpha catalytic subunit [Cyclospora cayetanensis]